MKFINDRRLFVTVMASNDDLNKLFEAALGDKQAPSRFGTPVEQKKFSPIPVNQQQAPAAVQGSRFQATPAPAPAPAPNAFQPAPIQENPQAPAQAFQSAPAPVYQPAPANAFQPTPAPQAAPPSQQPAFTAAPAPAQQQPAADLITLDDRGQSSLDMGISAELGAIMDAKAAREKRKRRRSLIFMLLFFVGVTGGAAGWVVSNPARFAEMKKVVAEIKSVGDIEGMLAKYQKALDKVAVRSEQIDAATVSIGVDPASAADMEDQGFDKEMRDMMGEDGGPTSASRNAKIQGKFKHVQESGSLMKGANEKPSEEE